MISVVIYVIGFIMRSGGISMHSCFDHLVAVTAKCLINVKKGIFLTLECVCLGEQIKYVSGIKT